MTQPRVLSYSAARGGPIVTVSGTATRNGFGSGYRQVDSDTGCIYAPSCLECPHAYCLKHDNAENRRLLGMMKAGELWENGYKRGRIASEMHISYQKVGELLKLYAENRKERGAAAEAEAKLEYDEDGNGRIPCVSPGLYGHYEVPRHH